MYAYINYIHSPILPPLKKKKRDSIDSLIQVAEKYPKFLKESVDYLGPLMTQIASTSTLEEATRRGGIEFLVTLSER